MTRRSILAGALGLLACSGEDPDMRHVTGGGFGAPQLAPLPPPFGMGMIWTNGQSLAVGADGTPVLNTTQPYSNVKLFDSSGTYDVTNPNAGTLSLTTLIAPIRPGADGVAYPDNIVGETPEVTMANQITALSIAAHFTGYRIACANTGEAGQLMSVIDKGGSGNAYAAGMYETQALKRLANALGLSFVALCNLFIHGESDAGANTNHYLSDLVTLQANVQTDQTAFTGQSRSIPMYVSQQHSFPLLGGQTTPSGLIACSASSTANAQYQAQSTNPGQFFFIGPKYQLTYAFDNTHMPASQYRLIGEKAAQAFWVNETNGTWTGCVPTSIVRSGQVVTISYAVPVAPLVLDTSLGRPHQSGNYAAWSAGLGFEAFDDAGLITIASVVVASNGTQVVLTLGRSPTTNLWVSYADLADNTGGGAGFAGGRCGCLHDSDTFVGSFSLTRQYNWAATFKLAVA